MAKSFSLHLIAFLFIYYLLAPSKSISFSKLSSHFPKEDKLFRKDLTERDNGLVPPSAFQEPSLNPRFYVAVSVQTRKSYFTVSSRYLSVSVSPRRVAGTSCIPWDAPKLQAIARGLTPAWLRVGGTEADYLTFIPPIPHNYTSDSYETDGEIGAESEDDEDVNPSYSGFGWDWESENKESRKGVQVHCRTDDKDDQRNADDTFMNLEMYPFEWDRVQEFAKKVGWKVIFALNVQLRSLEDWDVSNAISLAQYNTERGYNIAWELGNEPTRFSSLPNTTPITPEQLSCDFATLKNLLANNLSSSNNNRNMLIGGPDISEHYTQTQTSNNDTNVLSHTEYLRRFLAGGGIYGGVVDAVTWHQYYMDGRKASVKKFISPLVMDQLQTEISIIHQVVDDYSLPVWLGETGDALHGGAPGLSNTFVGGFLFLDKLGLAAAMKVQVLMHHTLTGINGLLEHDLTPLPTYWIAVLYKQLVGSKVLAVENGLIGGRKTRVYAHCTRHHVRPPINIPNYNHGDVTLLVVNTHHSSAALILLNSLNDRPKDVYFLTPLNYDIRSKTVALNGIRLRVKGNGRLPQFIPLTVGRGKEVVVPALSYGFVVIKGAKAKACVKY